MANSPDGSVRPSTRGEIGRAAEDEFSDEVVNPPDMVALRRKVVATIDNSIESSVDVTAVLTDGRRVLVFVFVFVKHAIGSIENPMTDALLAGKFHGLADPVLGAAATGRLIDACWTLANAKDVRALVSLAVPG